MSFDVFKNHTLDLLMGVLSYIPIPGWKVDS